MDHPERFRHVVRRHDEDNRWVYLYEWLDNAPRVPPVLAGHLGDGLGALIAALAARLQPA